MWLPIQRRLINFSFKFAKRQRLFVTSFHFNIDCTLNVLGCRISKICKLGNIVTSKHCHAITNRRVWAQGQVCRDTFSSPHLYVNSSKRKREKWSIGYHIFAPYYQCGAPKTSSWSKLFICSPKEFFCRHQNYLTSDVNFLFSHGRGISNIVSFMKLFW
jgi:hypothetical protein